MSDVPVRVYVAQPDGELELLIEADTSLFGSFSPNEGDIISFFNDTRHFRVVKRQFLFSKDRDKGWALLCTETREASHAEVALTWAIDNDWATDIDLQKIEAAARSARKKLRATKKSS
jgi:hypothetical protein